MKMNKFFFTTAVAAVFLTGCTNDDENSMDPTTPEVELLPYENGTLVLNEGNFMTGNASASFVARDSINAQQDIFATVNSIDAWGDTAQSMAFDGDTAYIVVNGSQKVEVVNRFTFESLATIGGTDQPDFLNPRYMDIANGKGYVTNWGDGTDPDDDFIAVVNLESNTVESTIPIAEGPERILAVGNTLYVALQGGFNFNNDVVVIDATSNSVTTTIEVGDGPNSLQLDDDGNLWVLSGGKPAFTQDETAGQLDKIDLTSNEVVGSFSFEATEHPGYLSHENGNLYYSLAGDVFNMGTTDTELPEEASISGTAFYDMTVNDGKLYGADAKDFSSNGSLEIYDLSDNTLLNSVEVGINPGSIYFNGAAGQ